MDELNDLISKQNSCYPIVLTGDFNIHYDDINSIARKKLVYLASTFGLSQFVSGSTHKLGHTIDLLFVNDHDIDMHTIIPECYNLSDHYPIFFELPNIVKSIAPTEKVISFRNTQSIDITNFASNLGTSLDAALSDKFEDSSFHELFLIYNDTLKCQLEVVAPLQTKTIRSTSEPKWLDGEYKVNRATRRRLHKRWKKSGLSVDKESYVTQRKLCVQMALDKRRKFYSDLIASKTGDQRALFSIVNKLFDKSKSSGVLPEYRDAHELGNRFNNFYVNKVKQIRDKIPQSNYSRNTGNFTGIMMDSFRPTTVNELSDIIRKSGIKTSFQDVLPAKILKKVIDVLLPHICNLVNKSLVTGSCDGLKESVVVPLLKKAGLDPDFLKNYRPVADLVFLSKLSERVVAKRLNEHMVNNNLLCKYEHAYKPYHSTETLLLCLVNEILLAMDKNLVTILLLIDMSAAFDTVDIDLLLNVLEYEIGVTGVALDWFESFLKGRNQMVLIENNLSDVLKVDFGVPQGSVLGPILFNIYIRSLFSTIENCGFKTSGYADDNNARLSFGIHFQHQVITEELPDLMRQIINWTNQYFLKINPDKTEIILFQPSTIKDTNLIKGSFLDGNCVRFSHSVKNLGFNLDSFLNMEGHVDATVSYCYKLISDVGRNRKLLSEADTVSLMHAIVSSRIDYCNSILYGINKNVMCKLQKVQNAAARLISKRKAWQSVRDVLIKLHWLRVEERIIFKILTLTFKCFHNSAPVCLQDLISVRSADAFLLNNVYLNSVPGRRSFAYCSPRYWNALPYKIRSANNLDTFKSLTKHLLFNDFSNFKRTAFMYN